MEALAVALGVEPEYFREYREWKAQNLVRQAMERGEIDLEDIELILAGKKYKQRQQLEGEAQ